MHILSKQEVSSPIETEHGEIIYELLGRGFIEESKIHSIAYVTIPQNKSSLLHLHPEAEESYYILQGQARIIVGDEEEIVSSGEVILIPPTKPHKIFNIGKFDLELLAICVPAWEASNTEWLE